MKFNLLRYLGAMMIAGTMLVLGQSGFWTAFFVSFGCFLLAHDRVSK